MGIRRVRKRSVKVKHDGAQKVRASGEEGADLGSVADLIQEQAAAAAASEPERLLVCDGEDGLYAALRSGALPVVDLEGVIAACEAADAEVRSEGSQLETFTIHGAALAQERARRQSRRANGNAAAAAATPAVDTKSAASSDAESNDTFEPEEEEDEEAGPEGEEGAAGEEQVDVSSDEGTSQEEEAGDDVRVIPAGTPGNTAARAGLDSDSDSSDDAEQAQGCGDAAAAAQPSLCGIPTSSFYLPPDPSRQPNMVLLFIGADDVFAPRGLNLRICPTHNAVGLNGGTLRLGEWGTLWGGEGEVHPVVHVAAAAAVAADAAPSTFRAANSNALLQPPPAREEFRWALKRSEDIARALRHEGRVGSCLLVVAANRSPLLEYIHSSHPTSRPQVLGPIMKRLQHVSDTDAPMPNAVNVPAGAVGRVLKRVDECLSDGIAPRIAVVGAANRGKSTLCKYLANTLLSHTSGKPQQQQLGGSVVLLDTDLGQPEFTPPGTLSLVVITGVLLGPSYTHAAELPDQGATGFKVEKSLFLGATSCQNDPFGYCTAVSQLLECYAGDERLRRMPLVVNTHGWVTGLGLRCLSEVLQRAAPHCICNTGGVGNQTASDGGKEDTQDSRVMRLLSGDSGISQTYLSYYDHHRTAKDCDDVCGSFPLRTPGKCDVITVVRRSDPASPAPAKGWWARQAALSVALCGQTFNKYCRAMSTYGSDAGHAMIRSYFAAFRPYVVPWGAVCVHLRGVEWEGGVAATDTCPLSCVAVKLERSIVGLYADPAVADAPRAAGDAAGHPIRIAGAPSLAAELVGFGMVPATSGTAVYLITTVDPVALSRVNLIVGTFEAPQTWFAGAQSSGNAARGRVALSERQGPSEKRQRLI